MLLTLEKEARKFIKKNKIYGDKFQKAFSDIALNPENIFIYDIGPIQGVEDDFFRMRIGDFRALFTIHNNTIIIVEIIGARGDIYQYIKNRRKK